MVSGLDEGPLASRSRSPGLESTQRLCTCYNTGLSLILGVLVLTVCLGLSIAIKFTVFFDSIVIRVHQVTLSFR